RGSLASMTLREAGERMRALDEVSVRYRPDGAALVHNGGATLRGLTVAVPGEASVTVDDAPAAGTRIEGGRTRVWFDLPAGATVVLRAQHGGAPIALGRIAR